jgi:hypothetical protein
MNRKLVVAMVSVLLLTAAGASSRAEAAQSAARNNSGTELKADENRTKQLRHGYIKYDKNKVYYYW